MKQPFIGDGKGSFVIGRDCPLYCNPIHLFSQLRTVDTTSFKPSRKPPQNGFNKGLMVRIQQPFLSDVKFAIPKQQHKVHDTL